VGATAAHAAPRKPGSSPAPIVSTETLPALLQRGAQAFATSDFAQAADTFSRVEAEFGSEIEWTAGTLPRRLLPLRGFAQLRSGRAEEAAADLAVFLERFPDETTQRLARRSLQGDRPNPGRKGAGSRAAHR